MPLGNLRVHRMIMSIIVLGRQFVREWTKNEWFRIASSGGTLEWVVVKCELGQI
jgi:hypothetical protein